jgi:hypothetical protein
MAAEAASHIRRTEPGVARMVTDRRRHKRVNVVLIGRCMLPSRQETNCNLIDISVGGAAIQSAAQVQVGERIVSYFDSLGGLEGHVTRLFDGGFAVRFANTQHKREKLVAQLTWLINRGAIPPQEERRHERTPPHNAMSTLKVADDLAIQCQVLDVSISGASVASEARPPIGAEVTLGRLRGRIVRHHDKGFGIQFTDIQNPTALRRKFG